MGHTLTDSKNRALCLNYRDGKRCRRLARVDAYWDTHHMAMCEKCATARDAEVVQRSRKGFTVTMPQFGPVQRVYHSIDESEANLEQQKADDARDYAIEIAAGDLIAQDRDWRAWIAADSHSQGRYDVPVPESFTD